MSCVHSFIHSMWCQIWNHPPLPCIATCKQTQRNEIHHKYLISSQLMHHTHRAEARLCSNVMVSSCRLLGSHHSCAFDDPREEAVLVLDGDGWWSWSFTIVGIISIPVGSDGGLRSRGRRVRGSHGRCPETRSRETRAGCQQSERA
jgi:hypothetical protein